MYIWRGVERGTLSMGLFTWNMLYLFLRETSAVTIEGGGQRGVREMRWVREVPGIHSLRVGPFWAVSSLKRLLKSS